MAGTPSSERLSPLEKINDVFNEILPEPQRPPFGAQNIIGEGGSIAGQLLPIVSLPPRVIPIKISTFVILL